MLEASSGKHFMIGAKQVKNAIREGKVTKVYIASDCDPAVRRPVEKAAAEHELHIVHIPTRKELGEMCGIDVKASCAAETLQ